MSQKTDRQLDGLILNRIFEDKVSGKDLDQPALQDMIAYVREGDQVIVHSMDGSIGSQSHRFENNH